MHACRSTLEDPTLHHRYFKGYLVGLELEEIVRRIPRECRLVGITVIFTHEWPAVVRLIGLIKAARPEVRIVIGGEHVSAMPEFCLATSQVDLLVLGEGEETIIAILNAIEHDLPVEDIAGTACRTPDGTIVNKRRARRADIDAINWPAWHRFDLATYRRHRFFGGMHSPHLTVPMLATRGCPYQCTYCSAPNMWTPRWIPRTPKLVADEIEHYVRQYGARNFPFQDLTAIIKKEWITDFCKELIARKLDITWQLPTGTRSEAIDAEVAALLRQSGMISMAYAPESGSETTRQLVKKKMQTDKLFASIRAAKEGALNVTIYLVIGFPHDTPGHLRENLPFIDRLVESQVNDMAVGFYMALPGTELFHSLYDHGHIKVDKRYFQHILANTSLIPVQSYSSGLPLWQLFLWKLRFFQRFYLGRIRQKGLAHFLAHMFGGPGADHESRLQSALVNAASSAWSSFAARFKKRWMPAAEEKHFFDRWDALYRRIHEMKKRSLKLEQFPADTTLLHESNVIEMLKKDHGEARALSLA